MYNAEPCNSDAAATARIATNMKGRVLGQLAVNHVRRHLPRLERYNLQIPR
jgi:hypothetical protein